MSTPIEWFIETNMRLPGSKRLDVGARPPPPIPNISTQFKLHLPNDHVTVDANGQLRTKETGVDEEAVYLNDFRDFVVLGANDQPGVYTHEPVARDFPGDYTSFRQYAWNWGPNKPDLPDIVFRYRRMPYQDYAVNPLRHQGRLVLDWRGNTIKDYRHLPLFISAQVEGWRAEALLKLDRRATLEDIVARMILTRDELSHENPMALISNRIQRRQSRFRLFNRCMPSPINVPDDERAFAQLMSHELTPAMRAANSTRSLTPLTTDEFVLLKDIGRVPILTGPRASITQDERGYAAYHFKKEYSYTIDFPEWAFDFRTVRTKQFLMVRRTSPDSNQRERLRHELMDHSPRLVERFLYRENKRKEDHSSEDDKPAL